MKQRFADRARAGRELASAVRKHEYVNPIVIGLPRGGVPVAFEIAATLQAPLDVLVVRKVGVPGHEELSMGAVGPGGVLIENKTVIDQLGINRATLDSCVERELNVLEGLERSLRGNKKPEPVAKRDVIVVDDGLATGSTMRAAIAVLRGLEPSHITVAIPVAPAEVCSSLRPLVERLICLSTPDPFFAVGFWYRDFSQTSTGEVRRLLNRAKFGSSDPPGHVQYD